MLDTYEYSPREFEVVWRLTRQGFAQNLWSRCLSRAGTMIIVCEGSALEYRRNFAVGPAVVPNATPWHPLSPKPTCGDALRMIHHGTAVPSRGIETMIEVMRHVDERFHLDLMLVRLSLPYLEKLSVRARKVPQIRITRRSRCRAWCRQARRRHRILSAAAEQFQQTPRAPRQVF